MFDDFKKSTKDIQKLFIRYSSKYPLALSSGSEFILQDENAQDDAIFLVCDIFNILSKDINDI